ncbi:hypothetical protein G4228_003347 [Cervus hanglu yarkandensis]|nr:hypothetical protein G4228_003347 [Cervus hanglu yarkandensis]
MGAAARSLPLAFCLLLLGTLLPRADACSCSPVHPQQAFCNADIGDSDAHRSLHRAVASKVGNQGNLDLRREP